MAIGTPTVLASAWDNTDGTSYATASVSPGGSVLVIGIMGRHTTGASGVPPSAVSGNGQTWVQENATTGQGVSQLGLWYASGVSPSAGVVTITFPSTVLGAAWVLYEWPGVDATDPFVQSVISIEDTAGTSRSVTLAAFDDAANATMGIFSWAANEQGTAGAGFTKLPTTNPAGASPNAAMLAEYQLANDTSVDASWTTSAKNRAIVAEVRAAAAGAVRVSPPILIPTAAVQHAATW